MPSTSLNEIILRESTSNLKIGLLCVSVILVIVIVTVVSYVIYSKLTSRDPGTFGTLETTTNTSSSQIGKTGDVIKGDESSTVSNLPTSGSGEATVVTTTGNTTTTTTIPIGSSSTVENEIENLKELYSKLREHISSTSSVNINIVNGSEGRRKVRDVIINGKRRRKHRPSNDNDNDNNDSDEETNSTDTDSNSPRCNSPPYDYSCDFRFRGHPCMSR